MDEQLTRRALTGFAKLVFNLRLIALVLTILWLPRTAGEDLQWLSLVLLGAAVTSVVPVLFWDRLGAVAVRHPTLLLADLVLAVAILSTLPLDSPFVLFVLGTALLAGALHAWRGAVAVSVALLLAYVAGLVGQGAGTSDAPFTAVLGIPMLIPLAAVGGAAVGRLLEQQSATSRDLAESAMVASAASERSRLAREMHDSLAKTLHGISLTASAMPQLVRAQPEAAAALAGQVADTARRAAEEARALLTDLRADDLERPLHETLEDLVSQWSRRTGIAVETELGDTAALSPSSRYELFCIVRETLHNVAMHADARRVLVSMALDADQVVVTIADDGRGFAVPADLADLADAGHFGALGMAERAASVGGRLTVRSRPGAGTEVVAEIPATRPAVRAAPSTPTPPEVRS